MNTINKLMRAGMAFAIGVMMLLTASCEEDVPQVETFELGTIVAQATKSTIESGDSVIFKDLSTKVQSREWKFPNGTPATSASPEVVVSFKNPSTTDILNVEVLLTIKHVDNTTSTKTIVVAVDPAEVVGGGSGTPLGPLKIAFVTENVASDAGYVTLLQGKGHTVEAIANKYANLDAAGAATLNGFDLIIISRNTNSANYGDASRPNWAAVKKPIILLSAFIARNNRLQFLDNAATNEANGTSLNATLATHPVFTNISLTGGNTGDISTAGVHTLVTGSVGTGTLIATANSQVSIAEWAANTASYTGATVFSAKRMFFAVNSNYALTTEGEKLFLNCVEYIITGAVNSDGSAGGLASRPLKIAFVTENFASDAGYVTLLEGKGHTVEAIASKYANLDAAGATTLNGFDLIIISRNTNSANYGDASRPNWASVKKPIILLSAFIARNNRLQFLDNATTNEANGTAMDAALATHPVFTSIALTAGNTGDISTASVHTLVTGSVGTGTLIATANGQVSIAEWAANSASYTGATVFASKRMFYAVNSNYVLTSQGEKLLLNCVDYIAN